MTEPEGEPEEPLPLDPLDLLRHARSVALVLPERNSTDFRRAVSAAYYALYHAVTLQAAALVADGDTPAERHRLARRFRHRHLRAAASTLAGADAPVVRSRGMDFISAVQQLNAERERADYSHFERFTQERAVELIDIATDAVRTVTSPAFAGGDAGRAFLQLVAERANARP